MAGALLGGACATTTTTTTGAAVVAEAGGQPQLVGTRWKLSMTEGGYDGRIIEFKRGPGRYQGVLTKVGRQLDGKLGAHEGLVLMELVPDRQVGTFRGLERVPGRDINEVICSVRADGGAMKCNTESTLWARQD